MRRSSIYPLGVLLLATSAIAQQDLRPRLRLKGPVKYAGIYHYGPGTWTRPGALSTAGVGATYSTIYNNTCSSPYFAAWYPGEFWTDEGRMPSTTSPDKIFSESQASTGAGFVGTVNECPRGPSSAPGSAKGSANSYSFGGFQIGYCSQAAGATTQINFEFRETTVIDGVRCAERRATAPAPQASFSVINLPGNAGSPFGCWAVSIDLAAAGFSYSMKADGTGDYATPARSADLAHLFSWTFTFPTDPGPTATAASGFFVQGNPANSTVGPNLPTSGTPNTNGWKVLDTASHPGAACSGYDGTVWDKHGANLLPSLFNGGDNGSRGSFAFISMAGAGGIEDGTGMSTQDCVRIDNPTANPLGAANGSYWFAGPASPAVNPFTSFHLEIYTSDSTVFDSPPGTGFCYGDGCAFTCPCSPIGTIPDPQGHHESGCANPPSFGPNIGAILTSSGSANPFVGETVRLDCAIDHFAPFLVPFTFGVKGNTRLENGAFPAISDGVRCVDRPDLIRFGSHFVGDAAHGEVPGGWHYPTTFGAETIPLSTRTLSVNGQTTWFQVTHRNSLPASFCNSDFTAATNWSNGMIIKWGAP